MKVFSYLPTQYRRIFSPVMNNPFYKCLREAFLFSFFVIITLVVSACGPKNSPPKASNEPPAITISSIEAQEYGKYTRIKIAANKPFAYNISNHYQPLGLVIEIPGVVFSGVPEKISVNKGFVTHINLADVLKKNEKQIEVRLSKMANYQVSKTGTTLFIDIEGAPGVLSQAQSSVAPPQEKPKVSSAQAPLGRDQGKEYVVGGRDVLEITVYDEPDLNRKVRVSNRGYISFPLIGEMEVAGLTAAQVEQKIEDLLKQGYLVNPQISISILEFRSSEIYVLGAVNKAGAYPLMGETNLLQALSMAGGIATTQKGEIASKELYIIREGLGSEEETIKYIRIELARLLSQGELSLNIPLKNGDTIYVPLADSIFIFGEVNSPGPYKLLQKEVTVLEAITMAGGLTKFAAANRTKVIRYSEGEGKTIKVDLNEITKSGDRSKDIPLKAGDVVVVPQSYF